jgi:secreted trypsin-like serine protease
MRRRSVVMRGLVAVSAAVALLIGGATAAFAAEPPSPTGPGTMIVGGDAATEALAVAFTTSGETGPSLRCGGFVIDEWWAATAAHCTHEAIVPGTTQARVGSLLWATGGTQVGVASVIVHPGFTGETPKDDIALVRLSQPVAYSPIPLGWSPGSTGTVSRTLGWGIVCDDDITDPACWDAIPDNLQQLDLKRLPGDQCALKDPETGADLFFPATMLCLVSADGSAAMACFGDSGGPVLRRVHGRWAAIGIVVGDADSTSLHPNICSTGPDGSPGKGMATNVSRYIPWVIHALAGSDAEAARRVAGRTLYTLGG